MKIALLHDWINGFRGGEKVLEALCELFPDAPLFTFFYKKGSTNSTIEGRKIYTSFLNDLPFSETKYRHYLPIYPLAAESLKIKGYDYIISTSHAIAKSVHTHNAKHWCYIHSPMRYVWDRFDDYFGKEQVGELASKLFFKPISFYLKKYDQLTSTRVDKYVSNSNFVAKRVFDFYGKSSEVIHPPVDVFKYSKVDRTSSDYYLIFSALVPYKKVDHAILACQNLGRKLIILGQGPELTKLKSISNKNLIIFKEATDDAVIAHYFSQARALIFPGIEDFGIIPVEANSSGLPVIGLNIGGLKDSQNSETCLFYDLQTVESLQNAILKFESISFNSEKIKSHSLQFSSENFKTKVKISLNSMGLKI